MSLGEKQVLWFQYTYYIYFSTYMWQDFCRRPLSWCEIQYDKDAGTEAEKEEYLQYSPITIIKKFNMQKLLLKFKKMPDQLYHSDLDVIFLALLITIFILKNAF